ncbi:MAG: transposase, partial [Burkholderiaceae bacterium]|nr:transposase [Burkholderiaceae bacterium]
MTPTTEHTPTESTSQSNFHALIREKLMLAVRMTLMTILEEELTRVVGAERYQRNEQRQDRRNGHYTRDLTTSFGQLEDLVVPRTRGGYQTQLFERYHRRQSELDLAIGEMFVAGASQVAVGNIVEKLVGQQPSPSTVSRVYHSLESEFAAWKNRPLDAHYLYAFADGTYFNVIYDG